MTELNVSPAWRNIALNLQRAELYDLDEPRTCYKCKQTMPLRAFPISKGKPRNMCRVCYNNGQRRYWRNKNPAK